METTFTVRKTRKASALQMRGVQLGARVCMLTLSD